MPYAFSRDEQTLLYLDGHGLTRFAAKGRPRTTPKVSSGDGAVVTVDDSGRQCVVFDPYTSQYSALSVSDLSVETISSLDLTVITPEGDERVSTSVLGFWHPSLIAEGERIAWPEPRATGLIIGPEAPPRDTLATRWNRSPGGDFAMLRESGEESCLYLGSTAERPWRCSDAWRFSLRGDGLSRVWADRHGATVAVHDQRSERAHIASFHSERPTEQFALATRCVPARRGSQWITQLDDHTLVAVDACGVEQSRWTLPRELAGAGELVVGRRRALWCAPDGERLFDLDTGAVLARALPAATEEFRPQLAAHFARLNAAGAPHGRRFELLVLKSASAGKIASFDFTMTPGDRSLASWSLGAMAGFGGAWPYPFTLRSGFSGRGSFVGPIDVAAVRALLTMADRASLSVTNLTSALWIYFEMAHLQWCCWDDVTDDSLLTRDGATLLFRALLAHLASPSREPPPPVSSRFAEGEIEALTLAEVKAIIAAMHPTQRHAYENLIVVTLALQSLPIEDHAELIAWGQEHITRDQYHPFWRGWQCISARVAKAPR